MCSSATLIESVPFMDNGSTSSVRPVGGGNSATTCTNTVSFSSKGVWYRLEGDGRCYTVSTVGSTFDTVLAVYSTTAGCEALTCLTESGTHEYEDVVYYLTRYVYVTSHVSWATSVGVDYYIFVAGYLEDSGSYNVSITVRPGHVVLWFDCTNCLTFSLI